MRLTQFRRITKSMSFDEFSNYVWNNYKIVVPDPRNYTDAVYDVYGTLYRVFEKQLSIALKEK